MKQGSRVYSVETKDWARLIDIPMLRYTNAWIMRNCSRVYAKSNWTWRKYCFSNATCVVIQNKYADEDDDTVCNGGSVRLSPIGLSCHDGARLRLRPQHKGMQSTRCQEKQGKRKRDCEKKSQGDKKEKGNAMNEPSLLESAAVRGRSGRRSKGGPAF